MKEIARATLRTVGFEVKRISPTIREGSWLMQRIALDASMWSGSRGRMINGPILSP